MFVSRLHCRKCGYKSVEFSESKNLYDNSYDLLFEDICRHEIVVRSVKENQLDELGIDLDGFDAASRIQAAFARSNENYLHMPVGDTEDMATNVSCPNCQKCMLTKSVCGVT